jgi:hypothetical protein
MPPKACVFPSFPTQGRWLTIPQRLGEMYSNCFVVGWSKSLTVWIAGDKNSGSTKDDEKIQGSPLLVGFSSSTHPQQTALDEGDIQILKTYV